MKPVARLIVVTGAIAMLGGPAAWAQPPRGSPGDGQGGATPQLDLRALLHIRPDQEQVYHAYTIAAPQPDEIVRLRALNQSMVAGKTPQRLTAIESLLTLRLGVFHRQAAATRALYDALSPDQQHTFDQITAPPTGRSAPRG